MKLQPKNNQQKGANYFALSFQMGVFIFLGVFGGIKLDKITGTHSFFTVFCAFLAIALSIYYVIYKETNLIKNKNPKKNNLNE